MPPKQSSSHRPLRRRLTEATRLDAPVLCLVKTGCATGSNLVATLHTTLETTLSDVRAKLSGIAAVGKRGAFGTTMAEGAATGRPVNYDPPTLEKVMQSRLHAFDLTAPFRFVRSGGSRSIGRGHEARLRLVDVLPRIPPVGLPISGAGRWASTPPFGTVVVRQQAKNDEPTNPSAALMEAIVVLFVAQGDFADDVSSERVVAERLMLQQQSYGRQMTVKQLSAVVNKWNANVKDFIGRTLLHECAADGNLAAVRYLLSQSYVIVDEPDFSGNTALALAVSNGHEDCAHALLEVGANVLSVNHSGQTPLHISLYRRFDGMTELLCHRLRLSQVPPSALLSLVDSQGFHPASLFRQLTPAPSTLALDGDVNALRALCRHYLFSAKSFHNRSGGSILHIAAEGGSEELIRFLIDEHRVLQEMSTAESLLDGSKRSPLHIACLYGHTAAARRLLAAMPLMASEVDITKRTPLQLALYRGHVQTAEFLLDNCKDLAVDSLDSTGHAALHTAASLGALEVVRKLVQLHRASTQLCAVTTVRRSFHQRVAKPRSKADVLRQRRASASRYRKPRRYQSSPATMMTAAAVARTDTFRGHTALWCAATGGKRCSAVVAFLIPLVTGENEALDNVLSKLIAQGDFECASGIVRLMGPAASAVGADTLLKAVEAGEPRAIRWLVDRKVGTASLGAPFAEACKRNDVAAVRLFLSFGASASTSFDGKQPMHVAIASGSAAVVTELLRNGGRAVSTDETASPLALAASLLQEDVVRGLCGLPQVATFDCVVALRRAWAVTKNRCGRVPFAQQRSINAIGLSLAKKVIPTETQLHFSELLHATASQHMFEAVSILLEKLLQLPSETRRNILQTPPPPACQPVTVVAPTASSRDDHSKAPQGRKKKKLYAPRHPAPIRPTLQPYDPLLLPHRQDGRDVFSYCCEAGRADLIELLLCQVDSIAPWNGLDRNRRTAADYAACQGFYPCLLWMVAVGVMPTGKGYYCAGSSKIARLAAAGQGKSGLVPLLSSLVRLGHWDIVFDLLQCLSVATKGSVLRGLMVVIRDALQCGVTLPSLRKLIECGVPVTGELDDKREELLATAVLHGASLDTITFLLRAGCKAETTSPLSKETVRRLKSRGLQSVGPSSRVSPLVLAAAIGRSDAVQDIAQYLMAHHPSAAPTVISEALEAAICCNREESVCTSIVCVLVKSGSLPRASVIAIAARRQHMDVIALLNERYGSVAVFDEEDHTNLNLLLRCRNSDGLSSSVVSSLLANSVAHPLLKQKHLLQAALENGHVMTASTLLLAGLSLPSTRLCVRLDPMPKLVTQLVDVALNVTSKSVNPILFALERQLAEVFRCFLRSMGASLPSDRLSNSFPSISDLILAAVSAKDDAQSSNSSLLEELERFVDASSLSLEEGSAVRCSTAFSALLLSPSNPQRRVSLLSGLIKTIHRWTSASHLARVLQMPVDLTDKALRLATSSALTASGETRTRLRFTRDGLMVTQVSPLALAVLTGSDSSVRSLLDAGANAQCDLTEVSRITKASAKANATGPFLVDRSSRFRTTALCLAVRCVTESEEGVAIVKLLVRRGALTRDQVNMVALQLALHEEWDALALVIDEALLLAQRHGDDDRFFKAVEPNSVHQLLRRGVHPVTHVMHACLRRAPRDLLLLVARHSKRQDVESCLDALGRTPLYYAVSQRNVEGVETLAALHVPMNAVCDKRNGRSALMVASKLGHLPIVTLLLKHGGINASDRSGNTPLMLACTGAGNQSVVELLLSAQADASLVSDSGFTAVMIAAQRGLDAIALPLAQHFCRLQCYTTVSTTLLHCAAQGGCSRLMEFLLRTFDTLSILDCDVNGASPLYLAYAFGKGEVLRQLLGALRVRSERPSTPTDHQIVECSSTLRRYGWLRQSLQLGETLQERRRAQFALPTVSSIAPNNKSLAKSKSLLQFCVKNNNAVGIRVLGDMGVMDDCCALHTAASCGSLDVLQLLLALEMSLPSTRDSDGRTALDRAIDSRHEECALFLLQKSRSALDVLSALDKQSGGNVLHRIAGRGLHRLIAPLVQSVLGEDAARGSDALYRAFASTNDDGFTPFEVAILCGLPETALKIAQVQQQMVAAAPPGSQEAASSITISADTLLSFPALSPSVRTMLLDFFGVSEVMDKRIFSELSGALSKHSRLNFSDVRLVGMNALRQCTYIAQKMELVLTVNHERQVLKNLTQLMNLPFRLKFNAEGLKAFVASEQVQILQWLGTSTILGKYVAATRSGLSIATVELDVVTQPKLVGVSVQGSTALERFCWTPRSFFSPALEETLRPRSATQMLSRVVALMKDTVKVFQERHVHPTIRSLQIKLSWNGFTPASRETIGSAASEILSVESTEKSLTTLLAVLGYIRTYFTEGTIADLQKKMSAQALQALHTGPAAVTAVHLRYFPTVRDIPEAPLEVRQEGTELIVPFTTDEAKGCEARISQSLMPLHEVVAKDVTILQIHYVRDGFIRNITKATATEGWKFKLEVEGTHLVNVSIAALKATVRAAHDALLQIMKPVLQPQKDNLNDWRKLHTDVLVARSVASNVRSLSVLFSKSRWPEAHRSGSRLMLSLNPDGGPSSDEIYQALWRDTVEQELLRARETLPQLLADMTQRLNTYLPSTSLMVDLPSIAAFDNDNALAAASLLAHNRSALILQQIIKGVSIGWDTKLGTLIRRHVRQVSIRVTPGFDHATVSLEPDGRLVFTYSLLCVQYRRAKSHLTTWHLPTSHQVASLLLIQIHSLHPTEVSALLDLRQGYACWSTAGGIRQRRITVGSSRGDLRIETRNVLNKPLTASTTMDEVFELKAQYGTLSSFRIVPIIAKGGSKKGLYRLRFSAPSEATTNGRRMEVSVRLHGQELGNSPILLTLVPSTVDLSKTTCMTELNTVVQNEPFVLRYRFFDRFGNAQPQLDRKQLDVDFAAIKGVSIVGWTFAVGGDVEVRLAVTANPVKSISLPLRFRYASTNSHTIATQVEVISADAAQKLRRLQKGLLETTTASNKTFFRAKVRDAENDKLQREIRVAGGLENRLLPQVKSSLSQ